MTTPNPTPTPKPIVIGTTLAAASDEIVKAGVAVARATGAVPWLVHAYTLQVFPPEIGVLDARWIEEQEEALREQMARQAERTGLADLPGFGPGQIQLTAESPAWGLVDLARRIGAGLLVLGAAEGGALHRVLLGSTASGVLRQAPCPVLAVRKAATFPPQRVEIAVDLSPVSAQALKQGLHLLSGLGVDPAATEALFVLSPLEVASSMHFSAEQVERFAAEELGRFLAAQGAHLAASRVRVGYPLDEILATLDERKVDLAILGTHGRKGFERLMVGSVAAGVVHRATCNLLVVPPEIGHETEANEAKAELQAEIFANA
jgi:nucleotide-binding universal stress UspA family protein